MGVSNVIAPSIMPCCSPMDPVWNPAVIDTSLDSRAVTFENPTGARGAGGSTHGGRKGAPSRRSQPGERVVLADIDGPGIIRHIWMTFPPARPETMRALYLEVFYDDAPEPSVSVPCLDFFGLPHGRPVAYDSALDGGAGRPRVQQLHPDAVRSAGAQSRSSTAARAARCSTSRSTTRCSASSRPISVGCTSRSDARTRRCMRRDFVIADGFRGPGRFLGCNVGVRVIDPGSWYGEGEVKIFRDGDTELPTICGTGLEDYVGSAWGLGAHSAPYGGAPLDVRRGLGTRTRISSASTAGTCPTR